MTPPRLRSVNVDLDNVITPNRIVLGKDVLELVSTAMYVDPLTVYREYVQNAADAIDAAQQVGDLGPGESGVIDIQIDPATRRIRIRDNGVGIPATVFAGRLTALGGSIKRGTTARGFRGVGRLVGLGYAQEVTFRSRTADQQSVLELRWDCRRLKAALADGSVVGDVSELISDVVTVGEIPGDTYPARFFEVELSGVVRQRGDKLMDARAIAEYLSQVAPVPFSSEFRFGVEIAEALRAETALTEIELRINGCEPLVRPHRDELLLGPGKTKTFEEVAIIKIPGMDGETAAIGWLLHHGYEGALPTASLVKGIRLRSGNLQVGDHAILEGVFTEPRFNGWTVGEFHVLDPRIAPNGRRDQFQENAHFNNLINHLSPSARDIARRCRDNSARRSKQREFDSLVAEFGERLGALANGALGSDARAKIALGAEVSLLRMEKLAGQLASDPSRKIAELRVAFERTTSAQPGRDPLSHLPTEERAFYERMFGVIQECAANPSSAQALIDRVIKKLGNS